MNAKKFFGKLLSRIIWGNLLAMIIVVVAACIGVAIWLSKYTLHGEEIEVPALYGMSEESATFLLESQGLRASVADSGYNKRLPANAVLAQNPATGSKVKAGRTIYMTINSLTSPTVAIPDLVDNCSVREATAKLTAMGFKLTEPELVDGERDWVYGIMAQGKDIEAGQRMSPEIALTLVIGNGKYDIESDYFEEVDEFPEYVE